MSLRIHRLPILALAATAFASPPAIAQFWKSEVTQPAPKAAAAKTTAAPARATQQTAPPQQTSATEAQMHYLVRTSLLALNDANRTGNYTVLRDLAAPSFREKNSAADLAQVFAEMRRAKLDLSMAALQQPQFDGPPSIDAERRMRLNGFYPTEPNRVVFDLSFEAVGGHWQLHGVTISTAPSRTAAR